MHSGSEKHEIETQLLGTQRTNAVMAARESRIDLPSAARSAAQAEATPARFQPIPLPNGAMMIRDEYYGSSRTTNTALRFLPRISSSRKIAILSDVTDDIDQPSNSSAHSERRRRKRLTLYSSSVRRVSTASGVPHEAE